MRASSSPQSDSQFTDVDGLRVRYKHAGRGPTLLLPHGTGSSLQRLERSAPVLAASCNVTHTQGLES